MTPKRLKRWLMLLAFAGTAANAASGGGPSDQDPHYCQNNGPGPSTCVNEFWIDNCGSLYGSTDPNDHVNNPCQVAVEADGGSFVDESFDLYAAAHPGALSDKVFDPIIDNFRPAQAPPPQPPITLGTTSGPGSWANQELMAQYQAWITPGLNGLQNALTYKRLAPFATFNGIASCEDYTYLSFQDTERWIDAINACKDDPRCKVAASLNGYSATGASAAPGIARRRPQNWDGNYIYDPTDPDNHVNELIKHGDMDQIEADPFDDSWQLTSVPKNAFHAGTEVLITPTIFAAMQAAGVPDAQGLVNELARGDNLYEMGQGVPVKNGGYTIDSTGKLHQGFYDEFDFHHYMSTTTSTTTNGESREYRRRNDGVTKVWAQLGDDMKCLFAGSSLFDQNLGSCGNNNMPSALAKVRPGDTQIYESDPFQSWAIMSAVAPMQMAQPPALFGQIGFGANLQPSQYSLNQLNALDITQGSQNIPTGAHAPGMLSAGAITNSLLFGSLRLAPAMVAHLSPAQIESIAATETRLSDILDSQAGQQFLQFLGFSPGANVLTGGGPAKGLGGLGLVLGNGSNGGAVPLQLQVGGGGGQSGGGGLSTYVATYLPTIGPIGGTGYMVDRTWQVNAPNWKSDAQGNPILDCTTSRLGNGIGGLKDPGLGSTLTVDTLFHTEKMYASTCELTNILLVEWYRKIGGRPSCLDMTSTTCDWVPQDFVDRFVTQNISYASAAKEIEYSYCKRWTGGGKITDPTVDTHNQLVIGVPSSSRGSLTAMRTFLDKRRDAFEALMKTVPVKGHDDFGKLKTDGNKLGNAQFGGGYSYTLGWHALAYRYSGADQTLTGEICRLGGSMNAGFTAFATLFSKQIDIISADVNVLANENDDHKGVGWANLTVVGFTVFDVGDQNDPVTLTASYVPLDDIKTDSVQFVEAPFQVGWVTVTIKAGIFFDYGAKLTLTAAVPDSSVCTPANPAAWSAHGNFEPQTELGVWVSADATIAGAFGVGLEVDLVLLGLGLPLTVDVALGKDASNGQLAINFQAELDFTLTTLKGELDFYIIAFFIKVASFKVVGWDGFVQKFPIFRTRPVALDLGVLPPNSILPPGGTIDSEDI